jgi:hypothetical protein
MDALAGHVFGKMQLSEAVGEHRVVARRCEQLALVDLSQVGEHDGRGGAVLGDE